MLHAVEEWLAADCLKAGTCDELKPYLDADLEVTSDIVGWWGVSTPFLPWIVVLIWCRLTQHDTQYSHG